MDEQIPSDSLDIVLAEVRAKLTSQERLLEALDTKATVFLGLLGIMLGVVGQSAGRGPLECCSLLVLLSVALLLCTIGCLVVALWVRTWQQPPKPEGLLDYIPKPPRETKDQLAKLLTEAYGANRKGLDRKAEWIKAAYVLMVIDAVVIGLPSALNALRGLVGGHCYGL